MTHENGPATASDQFVDTPSPGPVPWVLWSGHAWSVDAIARIESILEQRLSVHLASPPSGLSSTVNHENASGHEPKVACCAPASKKGNTAGAVGQTATAGIRYRRASSPVG